MSFVVRVRQYTETLEAQAGSTILEAALAKGLDYPHGCQAGNCGACKSQLLDGEVEMSPYSEFALSGAERERGLILACRAVPWSDCEVAYLGDDEIESHPLRQLQCVVGDIDKLTHDITRLRLEIESGGPFSFSAGQYAMLTFDGLPPREYSMANRPDAHVLEFYVRHIEGGAVSPFVHHILARGDKAKVEGPHGVSYFRERQTKPMLAVAGGSGLAPIHSIVAEALHQGFKQDIHLYFGVRDERDLYLEQHYEALATEHRNLHFMCVLSEPAATTTRRTGYLADVIGRDFERLDGFNAYLAGPPVMVETCVARCKQLRLLEEDCHADAFYTEADKLPERNT